jgi:hypothetical protein
MIHTQLASYGQLADEEITLSFLQRGGFLIFFDGLNEADSITRNMLNVFIERYSISNYFCISSQQDYPEFAGERVQLATLDHEKVNAFLRNRLGGKRAEATIGAVTMEIYAIYRIPQELELAIELLKDDPNAQLPRSRRELYERKISPIFRNWEDSGFSNYADRLMNEPTRC